MADAKVVFYDGVYTLGGRIVRMILALLLSVLLARVLGPHDRGLYALPTAVYTGLALAVFTGIFSAVSYFMLNENAGRGVLLPALLTGGLFTAAGIGSVIAMALLGHNSWAALPAILLLVANVPMMMLLGYAVGTKRIRWQTTYNVISTGLLLLVVALTFAFFSRTAQAAVVAFVFVNLLVAAACLAIMLREAHALPYAKVSLKAFFLFALRAGCANLITLLNYRGDIYVVAILTTPAVLGQYTVAISAVEALLMVTQIPAVVTSPHVGSMQRDDAARLTSMCVRGTLATAVVLSLGFYAVLPLAVRFLYGGAYMPIIPALRVLLVGIVILSLATPITNFFTLKLGKPEIAVLSSGAAACACIVLSWFLVPHIGIVGAAFATALAYLIGQSITITLFVRSTGISLGRLLMPTMQDFHAFTRWGRAIAR